MVIHMAKIVSGFQQRICEIKIEEISRALERDYTWHAKSHEATVALHAQTAAREIYARN